MAMVHSTLLGREVDEDEKEAQEEAYRQRVKQSSSGERSMQQGARQAANNPPAWKKIKSLFGQD